ncbi:MAG: hypothetical protein RMX96_15240 [Nostoc sp. ChiSLP02]|nr:hypothetical protein [Nostoc sp. DedSLP05]MDZ8101863.1 hypothetical protein [Nostoc sp. DedSLP01]MDZ8186195.1 hypothetical protein [Nostoc sp. ChiSLP02]
MQTYQNDYDFWMQWVFANAFSFFIGLLSFQTFFITPLVPGIAQWLILRKQIIGLSRWWILTNVAGIILYGLMGGKLAINSGFSDWCNHYTNSFNICAVFSYSISGAFGGLLAGVQQWFFLRRYVSLFHLRTSWILASTLGWTLGGFIGSFTLWKTIFTNNFVIGVFAYGLLFGMLNGAITGVYLIKIIKHNNRSVR